MKTKISTKSVITQNFVVNGKPVSSFRDLPPEVKEHLDRDHNNVPDFFEGKADSGTGDVTINGTTYRNWDEVPADLQYLRSGSGIPNQNVSVSRSGKSLRVSPSISWQNSALVKLLISLALVGILYYFLSR